MTKASHQVEVVRVVLEPHPNADSLSVVHVRGYTCCVRTSDWKDGDLAAYIPPDSVVPETPEYAFLNGHRRIRVRRLRGIISMGLLMPAPAGVALGADVAEAMGIVHYEPPIEVTGGDSEPGPYRFTFDVDALRAYPDLFSDGEEVQVTEKIHGASVRYCWDGGRLWCGSRGTWKAESPTAFPWIALASCPGLREFCETHPDLTVYGEAYGKVQSLRYGRPEGIALAVFDLLRGSEFVPCREARGVGATLPWVPLIAYMPYTFDGVTALAEGDSLVPGARHIREGVVVRPVTERNDLRVGRVIAKVVSNTYLEKDR